MRTPPILSINYFSIMAATAEISLYGNTYTTIYKNSKKEVIGKAITTLSGSTYTTTFKDANDKKLGTATGTINEPSVDMEYFDLQGIKIGKSDTWQKVETQEYKTSYYGRRGNCFSESSTFLDAPNFNSYFRKYQPEATKTQSDTNPLVYTGSPTSATIFAQPKMTGQENKKQPPQKNKNSCCSIM